MSLSVYIAHTGAQLEASPAAYPTIEGLREWIAQHAEVPASRQILMTARGKIVKYQSLLSEQEVFVYDRNLFAPPSRSSSQPYTLSPFPETPAIDDPPDALADESSLDAWKSLFTQRREWSRQLFRKANTCIPQITENDEAVAVIVRATAIATERVKGNIGGLQANIQEAQQWSAGVLREPGLVLQNWDHTLRQLASVKTDPTLLRLLRPPGDGAEAPEFGSDSTTFQDLVSKPDANRAASRGKQAMKWLEGQLAELEAAFQALEGNSRSLISDFQADQRELIQHVEGTVSDLSEEMQAVVHKIDTDCEAVLNAQGGTRAFSAISKSALMHTQNLLPSLMETTADVFELLLRTTKTKNDATILAVRYLQRVSALESAFADLKAGVAQLEISDDDDRTALDTLTFIQQLPALYGSVLLESVRRNEWTQKMTQDSSTLAEEMAVHKDDEERRRKKWFKGLEHYLSPNMNDSKAVGIDVNLTRQGSNWPGTSRAELQAYLSLLEKVSGFESTLQQLRDNVKALDAPSKQQARRSNAFKNGSVHEATFGRNSLLLRGDDEMIHTLQTDRNRLEDKLKGAESRIRKLEDLLHRQSQMPRPNGSPRASLNRQPSTSTFPHISLSPRGDTLTYRPSPASSRRVSQNHTEEDKAFIKRILHLEAELETERNKAREAQQFADLRKKGDEDLQQQVQEANAIKKDLMDNFEAQQSEFDGERRLLSEENRKLRIRLEELEEELDRLAGSYDNRASTSERTQALEKEMIGLRKDAAAEIETLQSHIKSLENEQHEKTILFESQLEQHREDKRKAQADLSSAEEEIQALKEERESHHQMLHAVHRDLARDDPPPAEFASLVMALDTVSRRVAGHAQELQVALDSAKTNNDSLETRLGWQASQLSDSKNVAEASEKATEKLKEALQGEKTRFVALKGELEEERIELNKLRSRLSDGETGSEALRTRVSDEERKVVELGQQIATSDNHSRQLEEQLATAQDQHKRIEAALKTQQRLLRDRSDRAEQISQLLFLQTDRLTHLLEHCGFSVTRQDEVMVIQRASRTANDKEGLALKPSESIDRTTSGPMPSFAESEPPDYIHWALADNEEIEGQQFEAFHHESKAFDMEAFCDAIVKRIKDIEHIARKWQREAKNYRDRFHRTQFDSQHKIAFRGFKEGDLALFLPTRNQAPKRSWAAFNVGAPHYFLREQDSHRLNSRDWLLARISGVEERVVDLSKQSERPLARRLLNLPGAEDAAAEDENPFGLSDGLRWYYLDAAEEKVGAPMLPGAAKTTVASAHVDASGSIPRKEKPDDVTATKTLAKSLDSRRSSANSRHSIFGSSPAAGNAATGPATGSPAEHAGSSLKDVARAEDEPNGGEQPPDDTNQPHSPGSREHTATIVSPSKPSRPTSPLKNKAWDALLSLDLNLDGKGKGRK